MYKVGQIEIHRLVDARVWVDPGGAFGVVPCLLWERAVKPDAQGRVPMDLAYLLARAGGQTILVETGIGDKLTPRQLGHWGLNEPGNLVSALARLGATPADVDTVHFERLRP